MTSDCMDDRTDSVSGRSGALGAESMEKDKAVGVDGADRVGLLAALMREIDSDEGYLSDGWLERLRFLDFTPSTAAEFLVGCLPLIKPHVSCMSLEIQDAIDGIRGPVKHIMFSTGGWSGAEDLIDAMMKHFWITHFHTQWNRGGHFQFEVPVRHLKVPTLNPQESASSASPTTLEASKRPEGAPTEIQK